MLADESIVPLRRDPYSVVKRFAFSFNGYQAFAGQPRPRELASGTYEQWEPEHEIPSELCSALLR